MKLLKTSTTVCFAALLGAVCATSAKADDWNNKTTMTFSGPVEIPGVHLTGYGILPAGTYVFKLLDSKSDRHIVQIFSQDEKTVFATILAIPNYRLKATDKTVITFSERPAGEPEALRAWFYPGKNWGDEFVYPKARAMEIAKVSKQPVLYTDAAIPAEVAEPIKSVKAPVVMQMQKAPVMAVQPTGEQVEIATVVIAPPPAEMEVATTPMPIAAALPATASTLPLIGLIGLMSLCAALSLRAIENRVR
jgi:hypothetical protein